MNHPIESSHCNSAAYSAGLISGDLEGGGISGLLEQSLVSKITWVGGGSD